MFIDDVQSKITENAAKELVCNLTEEQKEKLGAVQKAANTETVAAAVGASVSSVSIADAIAARLAGSSDGTVVGIFADEIHFVDPSTKELIIIPCAVSKATNICTSGIKNATVYKAYANMEFTHSDKGLAVHNEVNSSVPELFVKAQSDITTDKIIKKVAPNEVDMSATLFPQDMHLADQFNQLVVAQMNLKTEMFIDFFAKFHGTNDSAALLTIYRNANRAMADDIFDVEWTISMGQLDDGNAEDVEKYNTALKNFHAGLSTIGSQFISSDTARFGLELRKMTIKDNVDVTNRTRIARIKRFGQGSYYSSVNVNTGAKRVPVTQDTLREHLNDICAISTTAMRLIESEARLQNGYKGITVGEVPTIKTSSRSRKYAEILGLTEEQEGTIITELQEHFRSLAKRVIDGVAARQQTANLEEMAQLLGRR